MGGVSGCKCLIAASCFRAWTSVRTSLVLAVTFWAVLRVSYHCIVGYSLESTNGDFFRECIPDEASLYSEEATGVLQSSCSLQYKRTQNIGVILCYVSLQSK